MMNYEKLSKDEIVKFGKNYFFDMRGFPDKKLRDSMIRLVKKK